MQKGQEATIGMKRITKAAIIAVAVIISLIVCCLLASYLINRGMIEEGIKETATSQTQLSIHITQDEEKRIKDLEPECAIVLGAGIRDKETPTMMLKDRLDLAVELYKKKLVPKLLLTGDNGQKEHNEIHVMLNYCLAAGVPKEDIFCDHAGFSTYESMYRADYIFEVKRAVVVTQYYHLFRALHLARNFGIDALGTASDQQQPYPYQSPRNQREILARVKDYFMVMWKPEPTYLGEKIPITGESGTVSHGE